MYLNAEQLQYGKKEGRNEGNVLFNDALNTFYLRLYGVGHMVKDHSDSSQYGKKTTTTTTTTTLSNCILVYCPTVCRKVKAKYNQTTISK